MTPISKTLLAVVAVVGITFTAGSARAADAGFPRPAGLDDSVVVAPPFDSRYLLVVTREMRDSSDPAMVVCFAPLTLTVDVALLPFEVALGFLN